MAWEARLGLKPEGAGQLLERCGWLNGLGSPSGIETAHVATADVQKCRAKWPGKPVWD